MVDSRLKSKIPSKINTVMKKRGACILKKAGELSILCDVRVCALIADPNNGKFHTWPENHTQVIHLLKQFKNVENKKKKKEKSCDVDAITNNGQTENKMKNLDFSCFDDKFINQLSRDSVAETSKLLSSKIEAARLRAEFLKKNMTVSNEGFQHFSASPNFDPNLFDPFEMMIDFPAFHSILPSSFSDSYFGLEQLGAIGMGSNWKNFNFEHGFMLDSSIKVPDYYFDQEQVCTTGFGSQCNFSSEPEFILDFPPPLSYSPSVDDGCSTIMVPETILDYPPTLSYSGDDNSCSTIRVPEIILDYPPPPLSNLGVDNGCSTSDSYFGSEIAPSGSTYTESTSPLNEIVGLLQHSPQELEEEMLYGGVSMATIPLQPLQVLDYCFY